MSQIQRTANHCDVCGHEWLPTAGVDYTHCTSGKCRSRKWDGFKPSKPMFKDGTPDVGVVGLARLLEKKSNHDPKTCRVYRCGICASL